MLAFSKYFATAGLVLVCFSCEKAIPPLSFDVPQVEIDLDDIVKRGYINALVDNNSFSYFIYKGHPMGYEYELLQLLAKQLDVSLKIKVTSGVDRAFEQLNTGEGDIIAFPLTITKPRREIVNFTRPHFNTYQVLVQRKPNNWRNLSLEQINDSMLRDPAELVGKKIYVIKGTSHELHLKHLSEELGGDILIENDTLSSESESLIRKVALGDIDYTVADHTMARINSAYYPNLDVSTVLSIPQQIAWALRKNSPKLMEVIDRWLLDIKEEPTFMVIYNRYFKSPRTSIDHMQSDYSSLGGNKLSPYDDLIKQGADKLGWDWRLLAAVVYQESKFNPTDESWAGARGLMQLMPETAKRFGATDLKDPKQSLKAGVNYLMYLEKYWTRRIPDQQERLKFVLASYNAGLAHILDARKLCKKYGRNEALWLDVQYFLLKKSDPKYYRDPLVTAGYCKCEEPVDYVQVVLDRFEEYKIHIRLPQFDEQVVESLKTPK
jgi:membrane-bound lytic murein transglycosylase F